MDTVLVTGAAGQVGQEAVQALLQQGYRVIAAARGDLDITDRDAVRGAVAGTGVRAVINCAAYNEVDKAESDSKTAMLINARAPGYLARACRESGAVLVHFSTDYVFGARRGGPFGVDAGVSPQGVYAASKLEGEREVLASGARALVLRTSWVFGGARSFVARFAARVLAGQPLSLTGAAARSGPTPARALAAAVVSALPVLMRPEFKACGVYHYCGLPHCTRLDYAMAVLHCMRRTGMISDIPQIAVAGPAAVTAGAARPDDSRLDTSAFTEVFGQSMPDWRDYLEEALHAST